jgi:hypothetical protein
VGEGCCRVSFIVVACLRTKTGPKDGKTEIRMQNPVTQKSQRRHRVAQRLYRPLYLCVWIFFALNHGGENQLN